MSNELEKKQRFLKLFQQQLKDDAMQYADNLRILNKMMTIEEATAFYKSGGATKEEYEEYIRNRECLETFVKWHPQMQKSTEKAIADLKADIAKMKRSQFQNKVSSYIKGLGISLLLFPVLPIGISGYLLIKCGVLPSSSEETVGLIAAGAQILVIVIGYIWGKKK